LLELTEAQHTSLSAPSRCVAKYIQTYFQDGFLPPKNTICETDVQPFESKEVEDVGGFKTAETDLDAALWEMMKAPVVRGQ